MYIDVILNDMMTLIMTSFVVKTFVNTLAKTFVKTIAKTPPLRDLRTTAARLVAQGPCEEGLCGGLCERLYEGLHYERRHDQCHHIIERLYKKYTNLNI